MINRCYNTKDARFNCYGGVGVTVCDEWKNDYISFYKWGIENGWQPMLQLDKDILGDGKLYSHNTCKFVTRGVNMRHTKRARKIEYKGEVKCLAEWIEVTGITAYEITKRLDKLKWSIEKTLTTPATATKRRTDYKITKINSFDDITNVSLGLYRIFWKKGGSSLSAVGQTNDGTRWFAPCNWTTESNSSPMVASTNWQLIDKIREIKS
jgi:hypothetical protein